MSQRKMKKEMKNDGASNARWETLTRYNETERVETIDKKQNNAGFVC
jgi:hypothetical protein